MYAIVRIAGGQYQAEIGKHIVTEKLPHPEGEALTFDDVLLVADGATVQVGKPTVTGASVRATVVSQFKGKKIIVFRYKPGQRYRRKQGHRQLYTRLLVNAITPGN